MALRTYGSDTLNGNWAEERSKPLRGVLSDFGHAAFPAVVARGSSGQAGWSRAVMQQQQADPLTHPGHLNMAQAGTIRQAALERPVQDQVPEFLFGRNPSAGGLQRGSKDPETTARAAFGVPRRVSKTAYRALQASGVPNRSRVEEASMQENASKVCSRKKSRPIGERFMEDPCLTQLRDRDLNTCLAGEEPSHCTAAQRAWVYSHDPVIKYHEEGVPVAPPAEGLSVTIEASPKNIGGPPRAGNRRCRSITLEREPNIQRGTSVWIDFHVGPGEA
eukprot:jgi/Undpi1/2855/HiC_scaffold_14.g06232.m1